MHKKDLKNKKSATERYNNQLGSLFLQFQQELDCYVQVKNAHFLKLSILQIIYKVCVNLMMTRSRILLTFFWKNKHDLIYTGLNVKFVLAFLANKKTKADGKISSYEEIRKYHIAIMFGSKVAEEPLPQSYYN